jgi:hypothetical protein
MKRKPFRQPRREAFIQIRLSQQERKRIEDLARTQGLTLSAYLRQRALAVS